MVDVAIIGCGVTGAAVAYHLAKKQVSVLILEAENDVSMGTTKPTAPFCTRATTRSPAPPWPG